MAPRKTSGKLKVKTPKFDATGLLAKIVYNKVGERHLMSAEDMIKKEDFFAILGSDPETTQINLNFLLVTAIQEVDKRMTALEKKMRLHFNEKKESEKKTKKRKLEDIFDLDADTTRDSSTSPFHTSTEGNTASMSAGLVEKSAEEGEIDEP